MKIVVDTNVILSALMSKRGASNKLLLWLFDQKGKINVVTTPLVAEFEAVLKRDANLEACGNKTTDDMERFIDDICLISHHQKVFFLWRPFLKDASDDMVLEAAVNSSADFIVTHNVKDFTGAGEKFDVKITTPKEFLKKIGAIK